MSDFLAFAATRSDPGYIVPEEVERANAEYGIVEILNLLGKEVYETDFESVKIHCPWTDEHEKPQDKNCRVYPYDNILMCFALHGRMTPVDVWKYHFGISSPKEAAKQLLDRKGIVLHLTTEQKWDKINSMREAEEERTLGDTGYVVQALRNRLYKFPGYKQVEYVPEIRQAWAYVSGILDRIVQESPTKDKFIKWVEASYQFITGKVISLKDQASE